MTTGTLPSESPPAAGPPQSEALYEVVNGERVEQPGKGILSNLIAGEIYFALRLFLVKHAVGTAAVEALVILDAETNLRRRPDVCFVSAGRWPLDRPLPEAGDWNVVPDLAIEVISPNDEFTGMVGKVREYFQHGVRQVWVVVPEERQAYVYVSPTQVEILGAEDLIKAEELLPGFQLRLADVCPASAPAED